MGRSCVFLTVVTLVIGIIAIVAAVVYLNVNKEHDGHGVRSMTASHEEHRMGKHIGLKEDKQVFDDFTHRAWLDTNNLILLEWVTDFATNPNTSLSTLRFRLTARSTGYMSIGFNDRPNMIGADFMIAYNDGIGHVRVVDAHGQANGRPVVDNQQSFTVHETSVNATHMVVHVERMMDTCDEEDYRITADTVRVLWAINDEVPKRGLKDMVKHTAMQRGARSLHLVYEQTYSSFESKMSQVKGVETIDLTVNGLIPDYHHTMYWCKLFHVKKDRKMHLVGYDVLVEPAENRPFVHHFVLYKCLNRKYEQWAGEEAACFNSHPLDKRSSTNQSINQSVFLANNGTFNPMRGCQGRIIAAWAYGSEGYAFPEDSGLPMFADEDDTVYMLEVHYDNQDYLEERRDRSGVRLYVTEELQKEQAAMFTFGTNVSPLDTVIPPRSPSFTGYSYCPKECSEEMDNEGVDISAGFLHTHLKGVRMLVRHIRDGVELPPILKDDHYDFNYQNMIAMPKFAKYLPGDELILECEWNTESRGNVTFGGSPTTSEMCLVFLYVKSEKLNDYGGMGCQSKSNAQMVEWLKTEYPDVINAAPVPDDDPFIDHEAYVTLREEDATRTMDARDFYNTYVDWSDQSIVEGAQRAQRDEQDILCIMSPKGDLKFVNNVLPPVVKTAYKESNSCDN